jgi:hypothetical protein
LFDINFILESLFWIPDHEELDLKYPEMYQEQVANILDTLSEFTCMVWKLDDKINNFYQIAKLEEYRKNPKPIQKEFNFTLKGNKGN